MVDNRCYSDNCQGSFRYCQQPEEQMISGNFESLEMRMLFAGVLFCDVRKCGTDNVIKPRNLR